MNSIELQMYLLVFKKPSPTQVDTIRAVFSDFDWSMGFAVEEIVVDDMLNESLLIQFVSSKSFLERAEETNEITIFPTNVEAVLTGKGQFFGSLINLDQSIENLDTFFVYLGEASENRNIQSEIIYKVEFGKYSNLTKIDTKLESLINS